MNKASSRVSWIARLAHDVRRSCAFSRNFSAASRDGLISIEKLHRVAGMGRGLFMPAILFFCPSSITPSHP